MVDKKITDLTEDTSPTSDDFLITTDSTTTLSRKIKIENLPARNPFDQDLNSSDTPSFVGLELTDNLDANNNSISESKTITFNAEYDFGNSSTAITTDFSNGQKGKVTLTDNATVTISAPAVGNYLLKLIQDATGSRVVTWANVKWASGTAPTISTTASSVDLIAIYFDGTNYYGQEILDLQ